MRKSRRGGTDFQLPLLTIPLDPIVWEALQDIAVQRGCSVRELVTEIASDSLRLAIHVYVAEFYLADGGPSSDE
jgi:predicted DNA-binding ribbon-helix-helix protein